MFKLLSNNSVVPSNLKENMVNRNKRHFFYTYRKTTKFGFSENQILMKNCDYSLYEALSRFNIS